MVRGHDSEIAAWAGAILGVTFVQPFAAFGIINSVGTVVGAAVFNDYYQGGNVEITYVGRGSFTKGSIRDVFGYAFNELGASRLTARTRFSNLVMRKLLPKMGFRFEITQKRYYGPRREDDALLFVLYRENATRWLEN